MLPTMVPHLIPLLKYFQNLCDGPIHSSMLNATIIISLKITSSAIKKKLGRFSPQNIKFILSFSSLKTFTSLKNANDFILIYNMGHLPFHHTPGRIWVSELVHRPVFGNHCRLLRHWSCWDSMQCRRCGFDPWVIPCTRAWQPTPVFLPEKSHRQRSLAGCSPYGHKELYTA